MISMFNKLFSKDILDRLKTGLSKTKAGFVDRVVNLFKSGRIDNSFWEELEEILITSDVGVGLTCKIIDDLKNIIKKEKIQDTDLLYQRLKEEIKIIISKLDTKLNLNSSGLSVILAVGVNGTGKTTSIAKLAYNLKNEGRKVMLSAADTFRAAASDQLDIWAKRLKVDIVKHQEGADPAAVVYDSIVAATARGADVLIVDTAGRLQTKVNLMEELKKIKRVIEKTAGRGAITEVLLVLDANTGQNAFGQAKIFQEAVDITGIILTKLDGTAKGGIVLGIIDQLCIPVKYIGIGEALDDLKQFHPQEYIKVLFG